MRYIELNSVRARMVRLPKNYPWSSFAFNALGEDNEMITPHRLYVALDKSVDLRQANYNRLFKEQLSMKILDVIRDAINKAWPLGGFKFQQKIEKLTNRRSTPKAKGRPKSS